MGCSSLNVVDNEGGEKNHRQAGSLPYFWVEKTGMPSGFLGFVLGFVGFSGFWMVWCRFNRGPMIVRRQ